MCKKKAIALLLSTVGVANSSMMTLEAYADENKEDLKNEKTNEESSFKFLTDEEKDKLDIDIKEIQNFNEIEVESEKLEEKNEEIQQNLKKVEKKKEDKLNTKSSLIGKVINVSSNLRIRENASTNSQVKGTLKNGEVFNIEKKENSWYKIDYKGIKGYVHSDYVAIVNESNSNNNSNSNNTVGEITNNINGQVGQVFNVSSSLRIRAEANTTSTILGYLRPNEKVNIISESNGWYKISVGSIKGYVSASYIKKISSVNTPESLKPNESNSNNNSNNNGLILFEKYKNAKLKNVSTNLRVRANPSTNSAVLTYLLPSDTFKVEGEVNSWYYVNINGKKGYAHKDYVKLLENNSDSSSGSGNGSSNEISKTYGKVLSVMKSQVGSPYVFGGAGETITRSLLNKLKSQYPTMNYNLDSKYIDSNYRAFDCSGLMQWAFKQVGINIGRSTYNQINNGVEVSLNKLKEGDLLFYSDLNHVGMYVGNGQWLESPRSGEFVRITNVPWNKIGRARRILK